MDFSELYIIDGVEKASRVNTGRKCIDGATMAIESFWFRIKAIRFFE